MEDLLGPLHPPKTDLSRISNFSEPARPIVQMRGCLLVNLKHNDGGNCSKHPNIVALDDPTCSEPESTTGGISPHCGLFVGNERLYSTSRVLLEELHIQKVTGTRTRHGTANLETRL